MVCYEQADRFVFLIDFPASPQANGAGRLAPGFFAPDFISAAARERVLCDRTLQG